MKPVQIILICVIVIVAALVIVLAMRNPPAPMLPDDPEHYSFFDGASCLKCHVAGQRVAQSKDHPIGQDCLRCHGRKELPN